MPVVARAWAAGQHPGPFYGKRLAMPNVRAKHISAPAKPCRFRAAVQKGAKVTYAFVVANKVLMDALETSDQAARGQPQQAWLGGWQISTGTANGETIHSVKSGTSAQVGAGNGGLPTSGLKS